MAQLGQDEKEGVGAVVTKNVGNDEESNKNRQKYTFTAAVDNDKQELKLEIQNKDSKQLFRKVFTKSSLQEVGFSSQLSLVDIKKMLQFAHNNEKALSLTISYDFRTINVLQQ